jgi:NAD(P)-dependent dehydrogenase (short-subunit alcohol dehydrogenase family)
MALREPPGRDVEFLPPGTLGGRVALVTGGGSGLGLAMAEAFARAGADVALVGRDGAKLAAAAASLGRAGVRVTTATADVREPDEVAAAFDAVEAALGPVSILANNAGANFAARAEQMSPNAFRAVTRIAYDGTFFCSTEFARRRMRDDGPGAIVNNAAPYAWTGFPGDAHSAPAKAATVNLTKTLAVEWVGAGIRVNCIAAGFFPHAKSLSATPETADARLGPHIPGGRPGRMREIGCAAAWLVSDYAAYVTGAIIVMDGGEWLRRAVRMPDFVPMADRESLW